MATLRAAGVWCAPVNTLADLANDEQAWANDFWVRFPDGFVGTPAPFEIDGWPGLQHRASEYGEHTDVVLGELGYEPDEIVEMRANSTIW